MLQVLEFGHVANRIELYKRHVAPPEPRHGEVRYRVCAYALNRADLLFMRGKHYSTASLPSRIGYEACGVVDAIGDDVRTVRIGDRVSSIPFHNAEYGVAGEFAITPEAFLTSWPERLAAEQACSIWMQYLTAYFPMRELYRVGPGRRVLITAASSSAGLAGIQVARLLGAEVVAVTRTADKVAALEAAGANHVVILDGTPLADQVRRTTGGEGVDLVYDPLGGSFVREYVHALRYGGRIVAYGNMRGDVLEVPILPMVQNAAILHPYSLFNHIGDAAQRARGIDWVLGAVNQGKLIPVIARVFSFDDALAAYDFMEQGTHVGKIVVTVAGDGLGHGAARET